MHLELFESGAESLAVHLDEVDEPVGGGVVAADGVGASQFRLNDLGQLLAQLHPEQGAKETVTVSKCPADFSKPSWGV